MEEEGEEILSRYWEKPQESRMKRLRVLPVPVESFSYASTTLKSKSKKHLFDSVILKFW